MYVIYELGMNSILLSVPGVVHSKDPAKEHTHHYKYLSDCLSEQSKVVISHTFFLAIYHKYPTLSPVGNNLRLQPNSRSVDDCNEIRR